MIINVKVEGIKEAMAKFDPKVVERVAVSTLNEVAKSAKTLAGDIIRNERGFKISKGDFDSRLKITFARTSDVRAVLFAHRVSGTGKFISKQSFALPYFGAKEVLDYKGGGARITTRKTTKKQKWSRLGSGVTVQVQKGGKIARWEHGFMVFLKSGHVGVFRRIDKKMPSNPKKQQIVEIKVITLAEMFEGTLLRLKEHAREQFKKRFPNKLEWVSRK